MEPALAAVAAAALIEAMTTDAWEFTKEQFARILSHFSNAPRSAAREELDVAAMRVQGGQPSSLAEERARLTRSIADLICTRADAEYDIETFLIQLKRNLDSIQQSSNVTQRVEVGRDGYIAGRDQHFSVRPLRRAVDDDDD